MFVKVPTQVYYINYVQEIANLFYILIYYTFSMI